MGSIPGAGSETACFPTGPGTFGCLLAWPNSSVNIRGHGSSEPPTTGLGVVPFISPRVKPHGRDRAKSSGLLH